MSTSDPHSPDSDHQNPETGESAGLEDAVSDERPVFRTPAPHDRLSPDELAAEQD